MPTIMSVVDEEVAVRDLDEWRKQKATREKVL